MTDCPLTGGCNCGAVRFEVTGPLVIAGYCHCKRCQRRSGAAASANAHPAPDTFRIVAGEDRLRVWKPDGGGEKWFCGDCGSSLFGRNPSHTPIRSAFAWGRSMMIPGFARASASSWRTPRPGSRSQTTGCPATPRVATRSDSPARTTRAQAGITWPSFVSSGNNRTMPSRPPHGPKRGPCNARNSRPSRPGC